MKENEQLRPKVGIGVMIFKDGKVLVGKRVGTHAGNMHSFPGGNFEYMESFEECAKRETREEAGIEIKNIRFLCLSNEKNFPPKHHVNICILADWESGEPIVKEPNKMIKWGWFYMDKIPTPSWPLIDNYKEALKTGKNFFDN